MRWPALPLDWIAILGIKFGGGPILNEVLSVEEVDEILGFGAIEDLKERAIYVGWGLAVDA